MLKIFCKHCLQRNEKEILGKKFILEKTAGFENDRNYSAFIMKNKSDKYAGIMILTNNSNGVYFDINYCPICR